MLPDVVSEDERGLIFRQFCARFRKSGMREASSPKPAKLVQASADPHKRNALIRWEPFDLLNFEAKEIKHGGKIFYAFWRQLARKRREHRPEECPKLSAVHETTNFGFDSRSAILSQHDRPSPVNPMFDCPEPTQMSPTRMSFNVNRVRATNFVS